MALKNYNSFASGELDPVLHDRVTLGKYGKGLKVGRNVIVTKTGSIVSRFARAHFVQAKNTDEKIRVYSPPNSSTLIEWGNLYVRIYDFDASLIVDAAHALTEADLPNIHFVTSGEFVYIFCLGKEPIKMRYTGSGPTFESSAVFFSPKSAPTGLAIVAAGAPAGHAVDYLVTAIFNGEETLGVEDTSGAYNQPVAAGQSNTLTCQVNPDFGNLAQYSEIRVYQRPAAGGAYGYIGSSTDLYNNAGALDAVFIDLGGTPDFTNNPPEIITKLGLDGQDAIDLHGRTGVKYQKRLLITAEDDEEAIIASRPGYENNYYRDFPYDNDSALALKSGSTGFAKVLRMVENDGLIVFTSVGVYVSVGLLSIDNVALEKKGDWVIDEALPPLAVPGGVFFVDQNTNAVLQLIFSDDILTYQALDQTIFSDHMFRNRTIVSWAFQDGVIPTIIVVFSDGDWATFTYHFEHEMRAWTRHDSVYPVEEVADTRVADSTFFVTNKDGDRYIEVSLPRRAPAATIAANTEYDKLNFNAFMDAVKTQQNLLNDSLGGSDVFVVATTVPGDWEEPLTLTCGTSAIFTAGTFGAVGTIMRFFDTTDRTVVDLEVTARASDNEVTVQPSAEFPSAQASGFRLYETYTTVTGLGHLEGESVGILSDGNVLASPYNDAESYTTVTVSSGSITLPDSERGAIIVVGRPIVADTKLLDIATLEQQPSLIESLTVNKLYMRIFETRGLFIANDFPEEASGGEDGTSVAGMQNMDFYYKPAGETLLGNRYKQPLTIRHEQTLPGSWDSKGQIAVRQVDPVHFEFTSIIPDVEILRRSDR